MIISEADAIWAADKFIDYFKNFKTIEDYLRNAKNEAIGKRSQNAVHACSSDRAEPCLPVLQLH